MGKDQVEQLWLQEKREFRPGLCGGTVVYRRIVSGVEPPNEPGVTSVPAPSGSVVSDWEEVK